MERIDKKYLYQKAVAKAAELGAAFQDASSAFFDNKTTETATKLERIGKAFLEAQDDAGITIRSRQSIQHRILTAQDWLEKNPPTFTTKRGSYAPIYKVGPNGERTRIINIALDTPK